MKTVWKFPFTITDEIEIAMPDGAVILWVDVQRIRDGGIMVTGDDGIIKRVQACIWALVDPNAALVRRRFRCAGTGHFLTDAMSSIDHVGTFLISQGALVFHLFEIPD